MTQPRGKTSLASTAGSFAPSTHGAPGPRAALSADPETTTADYPEFDATPYDDSHKVSPATFGIKHDPSIAWPPESGEWDEDGGYIGRVWLNRLVAYQDYVYEPHVRNLATVPAQVLERDSSDLPEVYSLLDGTLLLTHGNHRAAAALLRGDRDLLAHVIPVRPTPVRPAPAEPIPYGTDWDAEDGGGDVMPLTAGVFDEDSDWMYKRGQCLALATEISLRTGWPVQLEVFQEGDPNTLDPEHEDYDPDADPYEVYANITHAYVVRPAMDGRGETLLDIAGENDPLIVAEDREGIYGGLPPVRIEPADIGKARAHWECFLSNQDYEVAASFAERVLDRTCVAALDDRDRRLLHDALLAQIEDNHAGGVMGWKDADYERAAALFESLENEPETWRSRGLTDTGRNALLQSLVYPVHDTDHPLVDSETAGAATAMLQILASEFEQ